MRTRTSWISLHLTAALSCLASSLVTATDTPHCKSVSLEGVTYQKTRDGRYTALDASQWCQSDRPSYKQNSGSNYLYYISTSDGWSGWMVGSTNCVNRGGIAAASSAMRPEEITGGSWEEVYGSSWYFSRDLAVVCHNGLSVGASVGIVFAILFLVGIVILFVVFCCCKSTNKRGSSVGTGGRSGGGAGVSTARPGQRNVLHRLQTISHTITQSDTTMACSDNERMNNLPSEFVHVSQPPPYEAAYSHPLPPPYSPGNTRTTPGRGHGAEAPNRDQGQTHHQGQDQTIDDCSLPPPYQPSAPTLPTVHQSATGSNAYTNGAFVAVEE